MPWTPLAVLPNLRLTDQIASAPLALVPFGDPRVEELRAQHETFETFATRFTTQHGAPIEPAVLLWEAGAAGQQYDTEAMVAFRNAVSVATILRSHAAFLDHGAQHRIMYSDVFEFYPWMLDREHEHLISLTPAQFALHNVEEFQGQSAAGVPVQNLSLHEVDRPLLAALSDVWRAAYARARQNPMERALFRSLNMACAALAMPATRGTLIFDYGRQCALWVSAFEILAHHFAGRRRADFPAVRELLEARPLLLRGIRKRRYRIRRRGGFDNVALPTKLYALLYQARNDFLHGNAVTKSNLLLPWSRRYVGNFAPLLYRLALRSYLGFGPAPQDVNAAAAANDPEPHVQVEVEAALLRSLQPDEADD